MRSRSFGLIALLTLSFSALQAQTPGRTIPGQPQNRVVGSPNDSERVPMSGNVHPLTRTSASRSLTEDVPMQHMILSLKADNIQASQLDQLITEQQDPKSPLFHQFLSAADFGSHFGVSPADLQKVTSWLTAHGFTVDDIPAGHRSIVFSGSAYQVTATFGTEIRRYNTGGAMHLANATDPVIPAALADVVSGIVKLHDFRHEHSLTSAHALAASPASVPAFSSGGSHYLSPADYSTVYNIGKAYSAGIDGSGQTIAILARSNISASDVIAFRQTFSLPPNTPSIVIANSDPGVLAGDSVETTLDTEWSGAIAPKAAVKVIVAASTNIADGIDLAAQYAVNHNVAPVITLSYGSCEAGMGSGEMAFYNGLWQQAAAQGISVLVSAGDSGAAGCNGGSDSSGSMRGVNGLCSSPYSTCVGGTQFSDGGNPGQYWLPGNNPALGSAISYIPEAVWNESGTAGGSGLWAGGGGASSYFPKPSWQSGPGVPADGRRDVPDVSLTASGHDGYLIIYGGQVWTVGGTSAAAPSFAGLLALVNQKMGARLGNANLNLYPLASAQASGGAPVFHDVTTGSNTVPGVTGFGATAGYDLASGLGSVDAFQLVNHWSDGTKPVAPTLTVTSSPSTLVVSIGGAQQTTLTTVASSSLKAAVNLSVTGLAPGISVSFGSSMIAAPGSGFVAMTVSAGQTVKPGSYSLTVTAQGGGQTGTAVVTIAVPVPTFQLTANGGTLAVYTGQSSAVSLTAAPENGFVSPIAFIIAGLPTGVTASFSPATLTGTNHSSSLGIAAAKSTAAGSYPLTVTATGGGVTQSLRLTLTVSAQGSCSLIAKPAVISLTAGQSSAIQVVCSSVTGTFSNPLSLSLTGLPAGVSGSFSPASVSAGVTSTLTLASSLQSKAGSYLLTATASAPGFAQSLPIPLTLSVPSTYTLSANPGALSLQPGSSGPIAIALAHVGSFNASIGVSVNGLPGGVSATLSRSSIGAPGDGSTVLLLSASPAAAPGVYPVTIDASGGGIAQAVVVPVTITQTQNFSFLVNTNTLTLREGGPAGAIVISTGKFTGGFHSTITITFSGLAPGMNWGSQGATATNDYVNNTVGFTAASYTPVGTYPMKVTASGGGITYSAIVNVTVTR